MPFLFCSIIRPRNFVMLFAFILLGSLLFYSAYTIMFYHYFSRSSRETSERQWINLIQDTEFMRMSWAQGKALGPLSPNVSVYGDYISEAQQVHKYYSRLIELENQIAIILDQQQFWFSLDVLDNPELIEKTQVRADKLLLLYTEISNIEFMNYRDLNKDTTREDGRNLLIKYLFRGKDGRNSWIIFSHALECANLYNKTSLLIQFIKGKTVIKNHKLLFYNDAHLKQYLMFHTEIMDIAKRANELDSLLKQQKTDIITKGKDQNQHAYNPDGRNLTRRSTRTLPILAVRNVHCFDSSSTSRRSAVGSAG